MIAILIAFKFYVWNLWIYSLTGLRWFALCCSLVDHVLRAAGVPTGTGEGRSSPGAALLWLVVALQVQRCCPCSRTGCVIVTCRGDSVHFLVPPFPAWLSPRVESKTGPRSEWASRWPATIAVGDMLLEVWSRASSLHPRWDSCQLRLCYKRVLFPDICYQSYSPQIFI